MLLYRIFAFLYDVSLALAPTTIPMLLILYDGKVNAALKRRFNKVFHREERSRNLIGLEGNQLQVDAKHETETYFQQLKNAWA
ncbi:hypothetical protein OESDEN_08577 [Oesophagostomum dentatum]|uniref:Uncharacterized protein n=1 Tax=Oesophagostomum dentatum TaxID=61180 RepID=A0A0B1T5Y5_OESDE|nr:hypothetical protein OESDEN_08577 [Oesophagostomum dentatum]